MADSNITKHALAEALKGLMAEMPFEKINVSQICERCGMNRKSFYYHFKDKYDLVNWIFDTEFISLIRDENLENVRTRYKERWAFIEKTCRYFYENHDFYRKAVYNEERPAAQVEPVLDAAQRNLALHGLAAQPPQVNTPCHDAGIKDCGDSHKQPIGK